MQRANQIGIQISDQMLNGAITVIAEENDISFEELPSLLAADGIDYGRYRRDLRRQLIFEQLRQIDLIGRINVSQREINQCFAMLDSNVINNSDYNLSHILVSVPESATAEEYSKAQLVADNVIKELKSGADFGEMAITYSDSQTGIDRGLLGWRKGDQLPTLFSSIVGTIKEGEYSSPMQAVSGFHIIKINEMRSTIERSEIQQIEVRHILVIPNQIIDNETAKQKLEDAKKQINEGKEFGEIAKLLSEDPGSANEGGSMGWTNPGIFVEEFENIVNNTEIGVISEPFRSRYGWHILEVTGRRTHDNTEELKQVNCVNQIKNSKLANEGELWIRRIRDEAFVDKRI
jgi:peptidyl-prolyl cis-trans isomerase SurA